MGSEVGASTSSGMGVASAGSYAVVSRRAAAEIRRGAVWVYRSEIESLLPAKGSDVVERGAIVAVKDPRGVPLGSAMYSSSSQIALRLLGADTLPGHEAYLELVAQRVKAALNLRGSFGCIDHNTNACRLIFSEADGLPGIIADRYGNLIVVQLLTQGTAQDAVRAVLAKAFAEYLPEATVIERAEKRIQIAEELGEVRTEPLYLPPAGAELQVVFRLNGLEFAYNADSGQKTGAFLDQRLNYAAAAAHAKGRALDVCTYQGGFALHLAQRCSSVTGIDASRSALEVAEQNLRLNSSIVQAEVEWVEGDAFEVLRDADARGSKYDTIVLDPPAFAKSHRALEGAMRGYKELNLRALKMVSTGGTLVTCSCSHHVAQEDFYKMLADAAIDAKRRVQVVEMRGASPDHPQLVTLPESAYLKCFICRVV